MVIIKNMTKQSMHRIVIEKIIEYVNTEVESCRRIGIETLAIYSGYSRRHLHRLFMAETGMRLGEYIRRQRMDRVMFLLLFTRRQYQDIALSVGFDSQQSFNRAFRKATGMTPTAYREKTGRPDRRVH